MKVFLAHTMRDRDLVEAIATQLRSEGHETFRPDEMTAPANLLSEISAALRSADAVIAIVTGANPNVLYELGLAAGAGVPTLIVARQSEVLPVDVASVPYVQLTGDHLRDAQTIARRVKDLRGLSSHKLSPSSSAEVVLRAAAQDPAELEALSPSEFERLIAELFRERGYEVTVQPPIGDSIGDLLVRSSDDDQEVIVELKKLSKQSRVSIDAVRQLLMYVHHAGGAATGILVSTSGFTEAAIALAAGSPVVLRTLDQLLAAESIRDLLEPQSVGEAEQTREHPRSNIIATPETTEVFPPSSYERRSQQSGSRRLQAAALPVFSRAIRGSSKAEAIRLVSVQISLLGQHMREMARSNPSYAGIDLAEVENKLQEIVEYEINRGFGKFLAAAEADERAGGEYKGLNRLLFAHFVHHLRGMRIQIQKRRELENAGVSAEEADRRAGLEVSSAQIHEQIDFDAALIAAVSELPEELRTILRFRYAEGMTSRQIARSMGISNSTVKRRLSMAQQKLFDQVEQYSRRTK